MQACPKGDGRDIHHHPGRRINLSRKDISSVITWESEPGVDTNTDYIRDIDEGLRKFPPKCFYHSVVFDVLGYLFQVMEVGGKVEGFRTRGLMNIHTGKSLYTYLFL